MSSCLQGKVAERLIYWGFERIDIAAKLVMKLVLPFFSLWGNISTALKYSQLKAWKCVGTYLLFEIWGCRIRKHIYPKSGIISTCLFWGKLKEVNSLSKLAVIYLIWLALLTPLSTWARLPSRVSTAYTRRSHRCGVVYALTLCWKGIKN